MGLFERKKGKKTAMPLGPAAEFFFPVLGMEVIEEVHSGDYSLFLIKDPTIGGYQLGLQRDGMDMANIEHQNAPGQPLGKVDWRLLANKLHGWLREFPGKVYAGSFGEGKYETYARMLRLLRVPFKEETIMGYPVLKLGSTAGLFQRKVARPIELPQGFVGGVQASKDGADPSEFCGEQGAGVVFYAEDTKRFLLAYRSEFVNEPHTWGVWGGAIDKGEDPKEAVAREVREEAGYSGELDLREAFVFEKDDFRFTTFLAKVPHEFEPTLNWETEASMWCALDVYPEPLHFGLKDALHDLERLVGGAAPSQPKHESSVTAAPKKIPLEPLMQEFLTFLDPEHRYPVPSIGYVNRVNVSWLGICTNRNYNLDQGIITGGEGEILIQQGLAVDLEHLRKVVAHEVCHHVAVNELVVGKPKQEAWDILANLKDGHGPHWRDVVARINARYGDGFVTQTSDMGSNTWESKEVFLFIVTTPRSKVPFFSWATTVPATVVDTMKELRAAEDAARCYIVRTTNRFLVRPAVKAPNWSHAATKEELGALNEAIQQAQETGNNMFADYASGVKEPKKRAEKRWTLVMAKSTLREGPVNAWGIARSLKPEEHKELDKVCGEGRYEVRVLGMVGSDGALKDLPKFTVELVSYRPGILGGNVTQMQTWLNTRWAEASAPKKVARLFLR